jgi:MYXO-CTERM domain-containing protein
LSSASIGQDLINLASIAQPMGSGTYMLRTTTGTGGPTTYRYNMQVTATPDPLTVRYDESVSGDAAVDPTSVNLGTLAAGSNYVLGGNPDFDTDDVTFTIAPGFQLDSMLIEGYTGLGSVGFQSPLLGSATLTAASFGQDVLDLAGITQPLGPGTYLLRITTGTGGPTTYQFDFQVSGAAAPEAAAAPEPGTFVLAALGLAGLGLFAWRRRK